MSFNLSIFTWFFQYFQFLSLYLSRRLIPLKYRMYFQLKKAMSHIIPCDNLSNKKMGVCDVWLINVCRFPENPSTILIILIFFCLLLVLQASVLRLKANNNDWIYFLWLISCFSVSVFRLINLDSNYLHDFVYFRCNKEDKHDKSVSPADLSSADSSDSEIIISRKRKKKSSSDSDVIISENETKK